MPRRPLLLQPNLNRGPVNDLHFAASADSVKDTKRLLASGSFDIDKGDPTGYTPLMVAADQGSSRVAKILVDNGADVSIVGDSGASALFMSAEDGYLPITKMLVKAGAPLESRTVDGCTPLFVAAREGHSEVMRVLIAAGAEVDGQALSGANAPRPTSPLIGAAAGGHVDAVRQLLRANANASLTARYDAQGHYPEEYLPLDIAVQCGHSAVVRELIEQCGIEGCGGASGGRDALRVAARKQYVDIMATLTAAGVVDAGRALCMAASCRQEASVKFLLQQRRGSKLSDGVAYVNASDTDGRTSLLSGISFCRSTRIARMLVDAGADTTSAVRVRNGIGVVVLDHTPMAFTVRSLQEKKVAGSRATKEQLQMLEAIRRLLLQVEAVYAVSWSWGRGDVPSPANRAASKRVAERRSDPEEASAQQLAMMIPIMRRRARRRGVLLPALSRSVKTP
ncbi:unnamed protein product, partial [Hapterophycus canaliculatus]